MVVASHCHDLAGGIVNEIVAKDVADSADDDASVKPGCLHLGEMTVDGIIAGRIQGSGLAAFQLQVAAHVVEVTADHAVVGAVFEDRSHAGGVSESAAGDAIVLSALDDDHAFA